MRDLADALSGADDPQPFLDGPEDRAHAAYARAIGHTEPLFDGDHRFAVRSLGALPDTVYDDYLEDMQ